MITPMKKLTLLLHEPDIQLITDQLKTWGVVHVQAGEKGKREEHIQLINEKAQYQNLIKKLGYHCPAGNQEMVSEGNIGELFAEATVLTDRETQLIKQLESLKKQLLVAEFWGYSNKELFDRLLEEDIRLRCFSARKALFEKQDFGESSVQIVQQDQSKVNFILIEKGQHVTLPFEEIHLPDSDANELKSEISVLSENLRICHESLRDLGKFIPIFESHLLAVTNKLADIQMQTGFDPMAEGNFCALIGWLPANQEIAIRNHLNDLPVAWSIAEPEKSDQVPVLLENHRVNKLFEPITKIFQLPNYFELDLTSFIAVFYPIFFAYCLGDAGYGLILFMVSYIGLLTFFKKQPGMARLGMILGSVTALMGIVKSGSVFGVETVNATKWPILAFLGNFVIIPDDQSFVFNAFNVAIMIGIVQLFVAISLAIYKKLRFKGLMYAWAPVGKLMIFAASLIWFLHSVQGLAGLSFWAHYVNWILISGIILFIVFNNPELNILTRIGSGILPLFFVFSNMLGDILSYVRLFALGVASAVLGLVVNQIGMQIWHTSGWGWIPGLIFLVFGHGLNMGLAILGAFVHPLRLTFVEFYNNVGFEGGGLTYHPFRNIEKEEIINK